MAKTIYYQILEAIVTHPKETFTIDEIMKELPDGLNIHTLRVTVSRDIKNAGFIERVKKEGTLAVYKILKREIVDANPPKTVVVRKKPELNLEQIGEAMVRHIKNLEEKIKELGQAYSDIQTELSKEKEANKLMARDRFKKIEDLRKENESLRKTIQKLKEISESKGGTFKLEELIGQ